MQSIITLTITTGKLSGKKYTFNQRTTFVIGRNDDCHLCIPDHLYRGVSRYHCLLDINPPGIRIKDLGSLNGTYINKKKIGQRERHQSPKEAAKLNFPEYNLKDGDEITVGDTILKVAIEKQETIQDPTEISKSNQKTSHPQNQNRKPTKILDVINNLIKLADEGNRDLQALSGYKIVKLIGKSSLGEVYLAEHSQTNQSVAIKLMRPKVDEDELHIKSFLKELENLQALRHPNIVECFGYGYAENLFFLVMEYYKIGNVDNLMNQLGGNLPITMAIGIMLEVLDVLTYTHNAEVPWMKLANNSFGKGRGLVHYDLKPKNIFLCNINGKLVPKIADYGLAKSFYLCGLSGKAFTQNQGNKPLFIPRQQVLKFRECKLDIDVWAAAACLYNMLTGAFPRDFGDEPWLDVLQNDPVPIRKRNASIPLKLAEVIDLALVEKPEIYFPTAAEFKKALVKSIT